MERDFTDSFHCTLLKDFNSHAHVERDSLALHQYLFLYNFNSHAHVERDMGYIGRINAPLISTHTLTWSVTLTRLKQNLIIKISTHTLTWSVTESCFDLFNEILISTHTLTWSVTLWVVFAFEFKIFQLTRSRGA